MTYDTKCLELAKYFVDDSTIQKASRKKRTSQLAQNIQNCIEENLAEMELLEEMLIPKENKKQ